MIIRKPKLEDIEQILKWDKKEYHGDNFFTSEDLKKMITGKSINRILMTTRGYIIFTFFTDSLYITSLGGKDKTELLHYLIKKYKRKRYYTHIKPRKWDTKPYLECGFINTHQKGNLKDEEVDFGDDITKLTVFERLSKF